jgi:hypothetical protein
VTTMLHQSGLPESAWELALHHKNFIKNRTWKSGLPSVTTPAMLWFKSIVHHVPFVPFGIKAISHLYEEVRPNKQAPKTEMEGVIVGFGSKGSYRILKKNGQIVTRFCKDVIIHLDDQQCFPYQSWKTKRAPKAKKRVESNSKPEAPGRTARDRGIPRSYTMDANVEKQKRILKDSKPADPPTAPSTDADDMSSASIVYEYHESIAMHAAVSIQTIKEPQSYAEAVTGPQAEQWQKAIEEELDSHKTNDTWTHVPSGRNQRVIGCKWVFKVKRDQDGEISRYKARLTAKGYSQTHGVDYNETFAPTVRFATMRIFFAIAAAHN